MSDEEKQVPELEPFCVKRRFAPQITNLNDPDVRAKFFEEMEVDGSSIASEQQVHAFSISDETVDRHGDVVSASGWVTDHYNGVVLWAHNQAQPRQSGSPSRPPDHRSDLPVPAQPCRSCP